LVTARRRLAMGKVISRRQVLSGVVASGAAAGIAGMSADAEAAAPTVRGTWVIRPTTAGGGGTGFRALAAFAAGGVFVTTGSDEAGTGLGEWSSVGTNGFAFTYLNFHFGASGRLANTVKVRAVGTFHGSRLSGRATLSIFGPSGKRLHPDARFRFTGSRVRVEAP
jgi:hypothetical protein